MGLKDVRGKSVLGKSVRMNVKGHGARAEAHGDWTFFTGRERTTESTSVVKGFKKAARVYNNGDVTRQNDKNGTVKYDDKREKM